MVKSLECELETRGTNHGGFCDDELELMLSGSKCLETLVSIEHHVTYHDLHSYVEQIEAQVSTE